MLNQEQQIFEQINKAQNILITFSNELSGDAIASSLALSSFFKKLDKNVEIVVDKISKKSPYSFLPGFNKIKSELDSSSEFVISVNTRNAKIAKVKYNNEKEKLDFNISLKEGSLGKEDVKSFSRGLRYDLIIVIDTPDIESIGNIYEKNTEFFYKTNIINIDHHSSNESFGQINTVELTAVSSSEIIFNLISSYSRDSIDEDIATCLLTGMISKTRSFKTKNVTPDALATAAQLISIGADRDSIVNNLYRSRSIGVLKLWGRVLARLTSNNGDKLVWSVLSLMDFSKTNTNEDDLSEVIDELIVSIPEARVVALIYETKNSNDPHTKAIIYSVKNIDALHLIKELEPSGTKSLAKITVKKPILEAEKYIMDLIKEKLDKLSI